MTRRAIRNSPRTEKPCSPRGQIGTCCIDHGVPRQDLSKGRIPVCHQGPACIVSVQSIGATCAVCGQTERFTNGRDIIAPEIKAISLDQRVCREVVACRDADARILWLYNMRSIQCRQLVEGM